MNPKDIIGATKPPLSLVPSALKIWVAMVQKHGMEKYGLYNWRDNPVSRMTYYNAAMRHIEQAIDGDDIDPDSGLPHEAHAAASLGILLDALSIGNLIDDRPTAGSAGKLILGLTTNKTQ